MGGRPPAGLPIVIVHPLGMHSDKPSPAKQPRTTQPARPQSAIRPLSAAELEAKKKELTEKYGQIQPPTAEEQRAVATSGCRTS